MLNKGGEKKEEDVHTCTYVRIHYVWKGGRKKNRTGKDKYVILVIVHADCFSRHVVLEFAFFFVCFFGYISIRCKILRWKKKKMAVPEWEGMYC